MPTNFADEPIPPRLTPSPQSSQSPSPTPSPAPPPNRAIYPLTHKPGWRVTVTPYSPSWPDQFSTIASQLHQILTTATPPASYLAITHIGSTAIPHLAAKPNIDILITLPDQASLSNAIEALNWEIPQSPPFARYTQVPNGGGIQGRESFKLYVPEFSPYYHTTPERSVYLINVDSSNRAGLVQVRCYQSVKATLLDLANADLLQEYADVKLDLSKQIFENSLVYSSLKDAVVRKILKRAGWTDEEVDEKERLSTREWVEEEPPY